MANNIAKVVYKPVEGKGLVRFVNDEEVGAIPIEVTALIRTIERLDWGKRIEFTDMDGVRRVVDISCATLVENREVYKLLASLGLSFRYDHRTVIEHLKKWEPAKRYLSVKRSGWISPDEYVCPSFSVSNGKEEYLPINGTNNYGFGKSGTLEEWRENVCKYCENNQIPTLALCVGLSPVLLRFFPTLGTRGVNLVGRSSIGKTSALSVAASLWGSGKFICQWRATSNGLEAVAESHNDCLLILDELGQAASRDVGTIVYMLGNGQGKARSKADATARKSKEWRLSILSSGEKGIADTIAECGEKAKAGQLVRFVDIEAQVSDEFGIYDDLHNFSNGAELSNLLKQNASKYYGTAAEEFIKRLIADKTSGERILELYEKAKRSIMDKFKLSTADPVVIRVADAFALYLATGMLAVIYKVLTHELQDIETLIYAVFERWLNDRGGKKFAEEKEIVDHVLGFLAQHEARFKKDAFTPLNCLGIREGDAFYVNPKLFREEICKGLNVRTVRKTLKNAGILETDADGKDKRHSGDGGRARFVMLVVKS